MRLTVRYYDRSREMVFEHEAEISLSGLITLVWRTEFPEGRDYEVAEWELYDPEKQHSMSYVLPPKDVTVVAEGNSVIISWDLWPSPGLAKQEAVGQSSIVFREGLAVEAVLNV